jgi:HAD superfamily hydrolase (TIGR01549 family)
MIPDHDRLLMKIRFADIDAITFDFYNTLVYHRQGRGRGAMLMEYLAEQGLESDPWEHQVLYDVFQRHDKAYSSKFSADQKRRYAVEIAERVFRRLNVRAPVGAADDHAASVWAVLGPTSLSVFPEVPDTLKILRDAGYRLAVVSNWQCGLWHFCADLGIADMFEHVVASAEVGIEKPNPEIFHDTCHRMQTEPHRVLHVGDSVLDDIDGARSAGMQALLVRRSESGSPAAVSTITSLQQLPGLLGV